MNSNINNSFKKAKGSTNIGFMVTLLLYLYKKSDEQNPVPVTSIEFDFDPDNENGEWLKYKPSKRRETITNYLNVLKAEPYCLVKHKAGGWYFSKRILDKDNASLIIKIIDSSKSISLAHKQEIINSILSLLSDNDSTLLQEYREKYKKEFPMHARESAKALKLINFAVENNRFISFDYVNEGDYEQHFKETKEFKNSLEYGTYEAFHKRNIKKFEPVGLFNNNDKQYLIGYFHSINNDYSEVDCFEINKIFHISVLELSFRKRKFDIDAYVKSHPLNFKGKTANIKFSIKNEYFSKTIKSSFSNPMFSESEGLLLVNVECDEDSFVLWAMQYLNDITVLSPSTVIRKIRENALSAVKKYEAYYDEVEKMSFEDRTLYFANKWVEYARSKKGLALTVVETAKNALKGDISAMYETGRAFSTFNQWVSAPHTEGRLGVETGLEWFKIILNKEKEIMESKNDKSIHCLFLAYHALISCYCPRHVYFTFERFSVNPYLDYDITKTKFYIEKGVKLFPEFNVILLEFYRKGLYSKHPSKNELEYMASFINDTKDNQYEEMLIDIGQYLYINDCFETAIKIWKIVYPIYGSKNKFLNDYLANAYYYGNGVKQDINKAVKYYKKWKTLSYKDGDFESNKLFEKLKKYL